MTEGFNKVLEILANKMSRKAAIIALAMVLIYLLAVTPTVSSLVLSIMAIAGLSLFFTILQAVVDYNRKDKKKKEKDN